MRLGSENNATKQAQQAARGTVVAAKLRTDLVFVQHLVCKGHFRISNAPPCSTVSLGWMQEYLDNTLHKTFPLAVHSTCYM